MAMTHGQATAFLVRWSAGDDAALGQAVAVVYRELRTIATAILRGERRDHTLEPAALIHELYLRLARTGRVACASRRSFFAVARRAMRCILIEHARGRQSQRRGGGLPHLSLDDTRDAAPAPATAVAGLAAALDELGIEAPQLAAVVRMRYFEGRTAHEIAEALGISVPTVTRRWRLARAWLYRRLEPDDGRG